MHTPGTTTNRRLRDELSISAPAGAVTAIPAMPPMVITVPIKPLCQPWARRNTPRNGPIPACMSAMKMELRKRFLFLRRVGGHGPHPQNLEISAMPITISKAPEMRPRFSS